MSEFQQQALNDIRDSQSTAASLATTASQRKSQSKSTATAHKKPKGYRSFIIDELPPCRVYRTRSSLDYLTSPIEFPKPPQKYNTPFRRGFRYFGYPENLNLVIDTPPRVRSWGSVPEVVTKSNKHKRKAPPSHGFRLQQDDKFDPYWMGRLFKKNLLLTNPGLIPPTDKAAIGLGSKDRLKLIHPDFEVHNCPSDLYFPITEKSRRAFCRIERRVQEKIDRQKRAYKVKNPTIMKFAAMEKQLLQDEKEREEQEKRPRKSSVMQRHWSTVEAARIRVGSQNRRGSSAQRKQSAFIQDAIASVEEKMRYEFETKMTSPAVKTLCIEKNYPGMNRQLYERPKESEVGKDVNEKQGEDKLRYGGLQLPSFAMNIPEDVWQKLASVRHRQQQRDKNLKARLSVKDPDEGKFRTFTQLELRNEVMQRARDEFLRNLGDDLDTPPPPELFRDNRDEYEPYHDYYAKGEFPPQGPFYWKLPQEDQPSPDELEVIEMFIHDAKNHHSFTHHLPGLLHAPRHPYHPLQLDWMEKGATMEEARVERKTPSELHDMPAYVMNLEREKFVEKFSKAVQEGAKELVGPEIYELYKKTFGIVEAPEGPAEEKQSREEMQEKAVPAKRMIKRRRRRTSSLKPTLLTVVEEEEEVEQEEEEEEDEEEEEGGDEEEAVPSLLKEAVSTFESELEYKLSADLLQDEELPLQDIRFSEIEFPKFRVAESVKDEVKAFKANLEAGEPVRPEEEEPVGEDEENSTSNSSDSAMLGAKHQLVPEFSRDAVSHLQVMYQDAVKSKAKSFHRVPKKPEMEPPQLKDIFLAETFTEDIDFLLTHPDNIPKFLQLF